MTSLVPSLWNVRQNPAPGLYWVCNSTRTTTEKELSKPILPTSKQQDCSIHFPWIGDLVTEMEDILSPGNAIETSSAWRKISLGRSGLCPAQPDSILHWNKIEIQWITWMIDPYLHQQPQLWPKSVVDTGTPSQKPWGCRRNSEVISPENCTSVDPLGTVRERLLDTSFPMGSLSLRSTFPGSRTNLSFLAWLSQMPLSSKSKEVHS